MVASGNIKRTHEIMATADPILRSTRIHSQLKFRSKATSQRSFDEPHSTTPQDDDPLRILVPAQKKLNTIESQRVFSIVRETYRRLEAALLIPSLNNSMEILSVTLGSDLVSLLKKYKDITAKFVIATESSSTIDRCHSSCSSDADSSASNTVDGPFVLNRTGSREEEFHKLQQQIRHTVKSILRAITGNPSIFKTVHKEKVVSHSHLMEGLQGLLSVSNEVLLTTKIEEIKREEHMVFVAKRKLSTEKNIRQLEVELEVSQKNKDEMVCVCTFTFNRFLQCTQSHSIIVHLR